MASYTTATNGNRLLERRPPHRDGYAMAFG
jgi:hypothetical protein